MGLLGLSILILSLILGFILIVLFYILYDIHWVAKDIRELYDKLINKS